MRKRILPIQILGATAVICLLGWTAAAQSCEIIDSYSAVAKLATATAGSAPEDQLRQFHEQIIRSYPGLYTSSVLGLSPGETMDAAILSSLAAARESRTGTPLLQSVVSQINRAARALSVFPDFSCDFPIYIADTLGQLDGAGRVVSYHYQAAEFSDDMAEQQPIWRVLWVEGLASYASQVLTPGVSAREALLLPNDLEQRAAPMLSDLAGDLLLHLDEVNVTVFTAYFTYGSKEVARRGLPWRSGYYVGYVVAQRMAERHSLKGLAHLRGPSLRSEIAAVLRQLSRQPTVTGSS